MKKDFLCFSILLFFPFLLTGQAEGIDIQYETFWKVNDAHSILWDLTAEERLPHEDNMEMSGQKVSGIVSYTIDEEKKLKIKRHIIYPQLRVFIKPGQSKWAHYRAYLKHDYEDELLPTIVVSGETFEAGPVDSVKINGILSFYHKANAGLALERKLYPSMTERLFVEKWTLKNTSDSSISIDIGNSLLSQSQVGVYGKYTRVVNSSAQHKKTLKAGEEYAFGILFSAYLNDEKEIKSTPEDVLEERLIFLEKMKNKLILETPDPVLNTLFYFSKIRAAESIFTTSMGLVHSPGGGRYYSGVWANDQAEYSGPFFPYLGYKEGNEAAMNAYKVFLANIPEGEGNFWSSFEMNGDLTCCGGDRGDAAMIAFGASHYALASGDKEEGTLLWPLIEWSLDYCDRHKNEAGVINSDSDEMEGRIATGGANLSTSSLYYGALLLAIDLGKEIGISSKQLKTYQKQAKELAESIESYFGATIENLETYRYFKGHEHLRHWICLPLVMGINERKEGTLEALFSKLWTNNGVRVEYNPELEEPDLFWDRGTLYAFRGAFKAGGTDRALEKLQAYSQTRLLGFHVPYVVEAWPEGNMAHLSAESALYCRIFTEGLMGINPTGFKAFEISPAIPTGWEKYSLKNVEAFGTQFSVEVLKANDRVQLKIIEDKKVVLDKKVKQGEGVKVDF